MPTRRWIILLGVIPLYTLAMMIVSTVVLFVIVHEDGPLGPLGALHDLPGALLDVLGEPQWWGWAGTCWVILVAAQIVFIIPVVRTKPPRGDRPRSLTLSLVIGAGVAACLTLALLFGVLSSIDVIAGVVIEIDDPPDWVWAVPFLVLIGSWVFWSLVLLFYVRGFWADRTLGRLVGVLLAGSALEMIAILPIDIMIRRRTDCYCAEGSFFTLVIASTALLWLAGPGSMIAIFSKRHRAWRVTHCERCGYAKGPTPGDLCPECGHAWLDQHPRTEGRG